MFEAALGALGLLTLGLWGWAALLLFSIAIVFAVEAENSVAGLIIAVIAAVVVWVLSGFDVPTLSGSLSWLNEHIIQLVVGFGLYFVAGGAWSVIKWFFYVHNQADRYAEVRKMYVDTWADANDSFKGAYGNSYSDYITSKGYGIPNPSKNKGRIAIWIVYWPWSAVWTLLRDPITWAKDLVIRMTSTLMTLIAKRIYGRFEEFKS